MFGLQPLHLILILAIALLIFGPARFGRVGQAFRKAISEMRSTAKGEDKQNSKSSAPKKSK